MTAPDPPPFPPARNWPLALIHKGRFWVLLEPRDLWFGVYVSRRAVFVGVPCLVAKWERRPSGGRLSRAAGTLLVLAFALGAVFFPLLIALAAAGVALAIKAVFW